MALEFLEPQSLIEEYGLGAQVALGEGAPITLGQALQAEQMFCPADSVVRQDSTRRLGYLARMLAAGGSLKPEHEFLLADQA